MYLKSLIELVKNETTARLNPNITDENERKEALALNIKRDLEQIEIINGLRFDCKLHVGRLKNALK